MQKPTDCPLDSEVSCGLVSAVRTLNDEVMRLNQTVSKFEVVSRTPAPTQVRDVALAVAGFAVLFAVILWSAQTLHIL